MTTCVFAGHKEVYQANVEHLLDDAIEKIIASETAPFHFLVGGMGDFDAKAASAVRRAKRNYPNTEIKLELVLPYLTQELNQNKEYYKLSYDEIIVPIELADVHYKAAIPKRNRWMVDESTWLIAFVYRDFGGAYTTLKYAKKKGLHIINLADYSKS